MKNWKDKNCRECEYYLMAARSGSDEIGKCLKYPPVFVGTNAKGECKSDYPYTVGMLSCGDFKKK